MQLTSCNIIYVNETCRALQHFHSQDVIIPPLCTHYIRKKQDVIIWLNSIGSGRSFVNTAINIRFQQKSNNILIR